MSTLIEVAGSDNLHIDLVYATARNLAGRPIYAHGAPCLLHGDALVCLEKAARSASRAGLGLIVYDGYRPASVQNVFWQALPDSRYVADATRGSNHTRGTAVDVGLTDEKAQALDMGTGFDDMCEQSHHDRDDLPVRVQRNRQILLGIMLHAGFCSIATEWWHYELPCSDGYAMIPQDHRMTVLNP